MKKSILLLSAVLSLIIFSTVCFLSCSKDPDTCSSCTAMAPSFQQEGTLGNQTLDFDYYIGEKEHEKAIRYNLARNRNKLSAQDLSNIIQHEKWNSFMDLDGKQIICLIPYVKDTDKLIHENIIGILVYYKNKGGIFTKAFYRKQNGGFQDIKELNIETGFISANDLYAFTQILSNQYHQSITAYALFGKLDYPKKLKMPRIHFAKITDYVALHRFAIKKRQVGPDNCRYTPCPEREGGYYCISHESQNGPVKDECYLPIGPNDTCKKTEVEAQAAANGKSIPYENQLFYDLRDQFFVGTNKGQQMILDYYYISDVLKNTPISLSMAFESVEICAHIVVPLAQKVLANPNSSDIALNATDRNELISYLNKIKMLSTDSHFQLILDALIQDVQDYCNQSVQYIVSDFENS